MLRSCVAVAAAAGLVLTAGGAAAQVLETDWTERPDRYASAAVTGDLVPTHGGLDLRVVFVSEVLQDILVGQTEVPPIMVLQDWAMVPLSHSRQRVQLELGTGLTEWLGAVVRVPLIHQSAEFASLQDLGRVETTGIGDAELALFARIHDMWPIRAHVSAGMAFPSGSVDGRGRLPDAPDEERILPYALQHGAGSFAFLPSATLATENQHGTVGLKAAGRVYLNDNDRDWRPGNQFEGTVWMLYRFNDWVAGSLRLTVDRWSDVSGADPAHDFLASPMHFPGATGGTRVSLPLGLNLLFAEGPLSGHRIQGELLVPVHHDLSGPQLRSHWGGAISWGYTVPF